MGGSLIARHGNRKSSRLLSLNERTVNDAACLSSDGVAALPSFTYNRRRGGIAMDTAAEAVMKAILALIVVYVGTFFLVFQGVSQNPLQAAEQNAKAEQDKAAGAQANPIDPAKEADIRSLMELVGARDLVQDGANATIEQSHEKILATVPNNDKGQAFVNAFAASYQKKFDVDQVTDQLVGVYDQHFSEEEIRGLLQFYGSPLGQKVAAEMPKISREIQAAARSASNKAAKEALAEMKQQNPEIGQPARLGNGQGQNRWQQRRAQKQSQQSAQQQNPQ